MNCNILDYLNLTKKSNEKLLNKIILKDINCSLTYNELLDNALAFGKSISDKGYFNQPIGVLSFHQVETIIMFLGITYSGNYYIPLSEDLSSERLNKVVTLSKLHLICGTLADYPLSEMDLSSIEYLNYYNTPMTVSAETEDILKEKRKKLPQEAPLYVIFTSGSTGEPKGIIKTHQGMISFLDAYIETFKFKETDVLANQTPFYFDASAKDIYLMLKMKCSMLILDAKLFVMPIKLVEYLNEEKVSVIQWVPSALSILSRLNVFKKVIPQYLKKVLFVGEVFQIDQLKKWMTYLPDTEFINLYGASEICGICTYYKIKNPDKLNASIPIGYPLRHYEIYLVNGQELISRPGEAGEIYIKSPALALGYLNHEKKSREVFITNPLDKLPDGIYYRSGDIAMYDDTKALVFISRKDFQIKHMGHRIELGEIEMAACLAEEVITAGCVFNKDKIFLFYEGNIEKGALTAYLKKKLPSYMLPNRIIQLESLPLNANGKIDRVALINTL